MRVFNVYAKTDCPFCRRSVALLQSRKEYFTLTILDNARHVLTDLSKSMNWRTVPIITLIKDYENEPMEQVLIGGCENLERFLRDEDSEKEAEKEAKAKQAAEAYKKYESGFEHNEPEDEDSEPEDEDSEPEDEDSEPEDAS